MGGAVDMCSGLGACRKKLDGTMCPSYMVTKEEADSTRGRANVLRLAMAGRLGESGLGDEGVYEVLDLCLECRACKAECPVGVDMARFKSEFLADYWSRHGVSRHARVLGHARTLARSGQRLRAALQLGDEAATSASTIGRETARHRSPARLCPTFASRTLAQLAPRAMNIAMPSCSTTRSRTTTTRRSAWPRSTCCAPRACRPGWPSTQCCGRPQISKGLLGEARDAGRAQCRRAVSRMPPRDGRSCSASRAACRPCAKMRRRCCEARRRTRRRPSPLRACCSRNAAAAIAGRCRSGRASGNSAARPLPSEIDGTAGAGQGAARRRFRARPSIDLDAGCCGMAGSFGYSAEHFDVSRAIGERKLLPAVRRQEAGHRRGGRGHVVPSSGQGLHGRACRASGRAAPVFAAPERPR